LILAAQYGHEKVVDILLLNRASINARDSDGNTPLLITSSKRIIDILLSKGADVKDTNQEGITLLHLASTGLHPASRSGDKNLVELLLSKGAVKMQTDSIGRTAYDMALNNSNFAVLELLNDWQRVPLGLDGYSGALIFSPEAHGHFRDIMFRRAFVPYRGIPIDEPEVPITFENNDITEMVLYRGIPIDEPETLVAFENDLVTERLRLSAKQRRIHRQIRRLNTCELKPDVPDQEPRRHEINTDDADMPKYPAYHDSRSFNPYLNEHYESSGIEQ